MTGWKLALAAGALALAAGPLVEGAQSGAAGRHPSPSGSSSPSGSATSSSSSGSSSSGSVSAHSSGSSSSARSRHSASGAERRHPRPSRGARPSYGGGGYYPYYYPGYSSYYPPYYYGWGSAWYPYRGFYDGYYYGYYGWPAPYGHGSVYVYGDNVGGIRVMVHPQDAEVYVDGYYAGVVDEFDGIFQRLNVKAGRHELTIKREGYKTHRVRLYVPLGGTVKVRHRLESGASSDVTQAVIGDPDTEAAVDDIEAEEEAMRADDAPAGDPLAAGLVMVRVRPADASIYVDGEFEGTAEQIDTLDLTAGTHVVEVVRPGYMTAEKTLTVEADQTTTLEVVLERKAASE